jgi:predicted nucleic acid-binding protein
MVLSGYSFWDTNLLVYWLEDQPPWSSSVKRLAEWQGAQNLKTVTSSLSLGELLVHPMRAGEARLARNYSRILSELGCLPFGTEEAWRFAELRSRYPALRPPDAIQLACASVFRVDFFFTNDRRMNDLHVDGIGKILALDEAGTSPHFPAPPPPRTSTSAGPSFRERASA